MNYELLMPISFVLLIILLGIYLYLFIKISFKKNDRRKMIRKMFTALQNIHVEASKNNYDIKNAYEQLLLNFEKISEIYPNYFGSVLEIIEETISVFDRNTESSFERFFNCKKDDELREFIIDIRNYIKEINPFITLNPKEAELLNGIHIALLNGNSQLGKQNIAQLSREIELKNKMYSRKEKETKVASIVSIVGLIMTVFFGILSFINAL